MYQKILWMGVVVVTLGCWIPALAEDTQDIPVLTVLGNTYTASELGLLAAASECRELEPLTKAIIGPLFAEYIKASRISISEEELRDFCRRRLTEGELFTEVWAEWSPHGKRWRARQEAVMQLTVWKLQLALFNQYGGRVIRNSRAQPQAFDAMLAYVAERAKVGEVIIFDDQMEFRFWECFRQPLAPLLSAEEGRPLLEKHPAGD